MYFYKAYTLKDKSRVKVGFVYIERTNNIESLPIVGCKHIAGNWYYYCFPVMEPCIQ
jgi:hypothetical protein